MSIKSIKKMSDIERNNKIGMISHLTMVIVMFTFCLLQTFSGLVDGLYMLIIFVLGFTPVAMELFYWKKDTKTKMIKHLIAIGFAVFYTFCLFTSSNNLVFLFVVPMILIVSIYNDTKYTLMINTGTIIESFLVILIGSKTGKFGYAGMDSAIIQMVIMIIIAVYAYLAAHTIDSNLTQKLDHIRSISHKTESAIQEINAELQKLNDSSQATKLSMEEVNAGTADTAYAVQDQLMQTESIHQMIDTVNISASIMSENLQQTLYYVQNGNQDISQLVSKVDTSMEVSSDAVERLNTLQNNMKQMNSISKLIDDIAFQINIMALNANVEAARAGESGRGFAVVASQISEMSNKTKNATEDITALINNVSSSISDVVEVMQQMIDSTKEQKQCTSHTSESFSSIHSNTFTIRDNVETLVNNIQELTQANQNIANSIQTISASSEEVSALASEAMTAENNNAQVLNSISEKMQQLLKDISTEEN